MKLLATTRSMPVKLIVPELPPVIVPAPKSTTTALVARLPELDRVGARAAVDHVGAAAAAGEDEVVAAQAVDRVVAGGAGERVVAARCR